MIHARRLRRTTICRPDFPQGHSVLPAATERSINHRPRARLWNWPRLRAGPASRFCKAWTFHRRWSAAVATGCSMLASWHQWPRPMSVISRNVLDLGRIFDLIVAPYRVIQNLRTDEEVRGVFHYPAASRRAWPVYSQCLSAKERPADSDRKVEHSQRGDRMGVTSSWRPHRPLCTACRSNVPAAGPVPRPHLPLQAGDAR